MLGALAQASGARDLLARATGARLCYGEPVRVGERTVIPVARVRAGGLGRLGKGTDAGEGGGLVNATPAGYLEVTPEGTTFHRTPDPEGLMRAGAGFAAAVGLGAAAVIRATRK